MKILVLSGSPKGKLSVTRQYVQYLEHHHPEHDWSVVHVGIQIKKFERDRAAFDQVMEQARQTDLVLWAFPLYILLVPAGLKRFVELVHERGARDCFAGKPAATLSTSIHFHDHLAHDYMRAVSEDLGMWFVGMHSAEMQDLRKPEGQEQLLKFGRQMLKLAGDGIGLQRRFPPVTYDEWTYQPTAVERPVDGAGRRVVILHDASEHQGNLLGMVERLRASIEDDVELFNLRELRIKGNCLGCLKCAADNHCAYEGKDEFIDFYNDKLKTADVLVFAGAIVDRHLSSRWRQFFERAFFNTHMPSFPGKQLAFLVSGPLAQMTNLRQVLEGYTQFQEANLVDIVTDEAVDSDALDRRITSLATRLIASSVEGYVQEADFRGVGGHKVFRDHIFGPLRYVFLADHRYYKRHGKYDFPTRNWMMRAVNFLLGLLFLSRRVRSQFDRELKRGMVKPMVAINERIRPISTQGSARPPLAITARAGQSS